MTTYKPGDAVLVDVNGTWVPAVIDTVGSLYIDIDFGNLGSLGVERQFIKHDPSKRVWAVGDTVENIEQAKTLKRDVAFIDRALDIGQISVDGTRYIADETYFGWDDWHVTDYFPWTVLWVPNADTD